MRIQPPALPFKRPDKPTADPLAAEAAYVKVDVESSVSSSLVQAGGLQFAQCSHRPLLKAPIGLKEEELTAYLTELKVDVGSRDVLARPVLARPAQGLSWAF